MSISFNVKVNYAKALKKLSENNLYDGFAFAAVIKNYVLWNKSYLITTTKDRLVITPYFNKNNPNIKKSTSINKSEIECFSHGKIMKAFDINLINGKTIKYSTTAVEYIKIVERFNKWLLEDLK